ncbi:MAG: hydroxyphenylacetyl-CoA thioesterase PaaI [Alphaproteobacteria bacterium]|nr:hydroxyphenylacetyl-CoA thioesterase PaaI [Alphaproteobacteria bacterium]
MAASEPRHTPQQAAEAAAAKMFADDKASAMLGIVLAEVAPGRAVMTMTVREDMVNGFGILHGGLAFTLADSAFAAACNSGNRLTVAQSCDVDFVNPGRLGDRLTATCEETYARGRSGVYDVTVVNQDGVRIALFRGRSRTIGDQIDPAYPQA